MAARVTLEQHLKVSGVPLTVTLIQNPIIDDIVISEAKVQASAIEQQDGSADSRRVSRDLRDFLIRLGIDR